MQHVQLTARSMSASPSDLEVAMQGIYQVPIPTDISQEHQAWCATKAFQQLVDQSSDPTLLFFSTIRNIAGEEITCPDDYKSLDLPYDFSVIHKISELPSTTKKLRLILDVEYEPNDVSISELKANMDSIVQNAMSNGMLTGKSDAEIVTYTHKVIETTSCHAELVVQDPSKVYSTYSFVPHPQVCDNDVYIEVGNVSVHIIKRKDGVTVDLWAMGNSTDPLHSQELLFVDVEKVVCELNNVKSLALVSSWVKATMNQDFNTLPLENRVKLIEKYSFYFPYSLKEFDEIMSIWTGAHSLAALKEGWCLSVNSGTEVTIQCQKNDNVEDDSEELGFEIPELESDAKAMQILFNGTEIHHTIARLILRGHSPKEWDALMAAVDQLSK